MIITKILLVDVTGYKHNIKIEALSSENRYHLIQSLTDTRIHRYWKTKEDLIEAIFPDTRPPISYVKIYTDKNLIYSFDSSNDIRDRHINIDFLK